MCEVCEATDLLVELSVTLHILTSIRHLIQLHVKDVEDEAVESWAESVAQTTDPSYHSLAHTCTHTHTHSLQI